MKFFWLVALIYITVTISGEMLFTIPTQNPQRILFFVGEFIVIVIIYLAITSIINNIKKKK
ncbi:hypothetical protein [Brochothrix thermosphacta]|uniref:Uncharacterized protein n=1 Tax=Brochothrix thermosphacta TaxID=2756 RepID=A0A1D2LHK2_BROTH|nr:hypothetical protein [Brochothrix thermosphacta]ATF26932.1 hypothetical protein CNY62_11505 [Brochothrix thermosphacta]ATH86289.1 hypothetical protein CPF12_11185 [Brochothrix thermosphacta]MPQ27871.1 hypothetical protein [Brochothrix thermosphacta]ODJ50022.1 hypothetical protein BFR38_04445 [Brochothrix thermosphacta]ODJ61929.1 hypothetical protein BFR42_01100 [Brochothrix thermosphacta]